MKKRKILLVLAIIMFPWTLIPLAFYYMWRRGLLGWMMGCAKLLNRVRFGGRGGLVEETTVFRYYKTCDDSHFLILPRALGVQYIYAIKVSDVSERLTRNIGEIIRAAMDNVGGNRRTLISLVVQDGIERAYIHSISRALPGWVMDIEKEAFERSLRMADELRARSPTLKVSLCKGRGIVESLTLEGGG